MLPGTRLLGGAAQARKETMETIHSTTKQTNETSAPTPEKPVGTDGKLKHPFPILLAVFTLALLLDVLFFEKAWGWHWAAAINLYLISAAVFARAEGKRIPRESVTLMVLTSLTALLTGLRNASATSLALIFASGLGMLLTTVSLLNGQWMQFRLRELFGELFKLIPTGVIGTPSLILESIQIAQEGKAQNAPGSKRGLAVLRGLLIAIPLLLGFGLLLASADKIFSNLLGSALDWFKFEHIENLGAQVIIVLLLTWVGAAGLWHALTNSQKPLTIEADKPLFKPFLGMIEASIVLVSLNLLFSVFLAVQFRYFFAGSANVHIDGFTFAEYARRGFFELVAVALIASILYFSLASFTKRESAAKRRGFSILAGLLLAQVGVMLVSAFQRLRLYEQAYGFTSLRLAAHVFMVFLGVLLLALILMELTRSFHRLGLALVLGLMAFALVMVGINEDALIANQNIQRAVRGEELDAGYLIYSLSNDAVPELFRAMDDPKLDAELHEKLELVMACRYGKFTTKYRDASWQSTTISTLAARRLYEQHAEALPSLVLEPESNSAFVNIDGQEIWCCDAPDL
jgi:ABC-type multidrug transport system fused ATPase/permease subunit